MKFIVWLARRSQKGYYEYSQNVTMFELLVDAGYSAIILLLKLFAFLFALFLLYFILYGFVIMLSGKNSVADAITILFACMISSSIVIPIFGFFLKDETVFVVNYLWNLRCFDSIKEKLGQEIDLDKYK